jgi:hypothetical protein
VDAVRRRRATVSYRVEIANRNLVTERTELGK